MKWYLFAHDRQFVPWTMFHRSIGIEPTMIYSGERPIDFNPVIYHNENMRHGSFIKRLGELLTDDEYYGLIEYDCFVVNRQFQYLSEAYMREKNIDILACHLRHEVPAQAFGHGSTEKKYFSIGSQSCWSRRCLEWYSKNHTSQWCEIDFLDTPHRAGFKVAQNPYIEPRCCNYDPTGQNIKNPEGMVLHPVKHISVLPMEYVK